MSGVPISILMGLLLATGAWIPADAHAMPQLVRQLDGHITDVDQTSRTLTVQGGKKAKPLEFAWDSDTRFIWNARFTNATALKPGTTVRIHYRWPLFGKKYVTRVVRRDDPAFELHPSRQSSPTHPTRSRPTEKRNQEKTKL